MAYRFKAVIEPYSMLFDADRNPTLHEWSPLLTSERDRPIQDWMREFYPRNLFVKGRLNHWGVGLGGIYCVSAQVKALIEQLEPDVHQFLDVDLHRKQERYDYFILKFGHTMNCVDAQASEVVWATTMVNERIVKFWMPRPGKPLLILQRAIAGAHLWQTETPPALKFISNELYDLLKANDALTGLKCEKHPEG